MALGADALTTLAKAQVFLARTGGTGMQRSEEEDFLEMLIAAASVAIRGYTGRQFVPAENAATKKFRYDGSGILNLSPYELRAATEIKLYSDLETGAQQVLTPQTPSAAGQYRLEPRQKTVQQTYRWLVLPTFELPRTALATEREVSITGDWGIGSVPADVEFACLRTVAHWYRNPEGFASRSLGELAVSDAIDTDDEALPRSARLLLSPYRD